jgi:cell division transport system permease protein
MEFRAALKRAQRGFREDTRLYVVAITSLTVAFLCLGAALLGIENLSSIADRWGQSGRVTIYLRDTASANDIEELKLLIESLPEVADVQHLTSAEARAAFLENTVSGSSLSGLPTDVFPASLEASITQGTAVARMDAIVARVVRFRSVEDVETYRGWFERLESLLATGRLVSAALASLVVVCVLAVVGNTIRLLVAGRRREIEVMKLCGATDRFVRGPFLIEGAIQGLLAAALALLLMGLAFIAIRGELDATLSPFTGVPSVFLSPKIMLAIALGGGAVGVLGSALSLRRYLAV